MEEVCCSNEEVINTKYSFTIIQIIIILLKFDITFFTCCLCQRIHFFRRPSPLLLLLLYSFLRVFLFAIIFISHTFTLLFHDCICKFWNKLIIYIFFKCKKRMCFGFLGSSSVTFNKIFRENQVFFLVDKCLGILY